MSSNGTSATQVRNDGVLINVASGMGTAKDKSEYTAVNQAVQLTAREREELAQDVFIGRICSACPDAATAKGWSVWVGSEDEEADEIDKFNQYAATIGGVSEDEEMVTPQELFGWGGYLANVHRGAALILNVDDGRHPSEPINLKRIKTIASVEVLDSEHILPDLTKTQDPYRATHYDVLLSSSMIGGDRASGLPDRLTEMFSNVEQRKTESGINLYYKIHRSRVLRLPGVKIPPTVMLRNSGWDRSLVEQVWESFRDWKSTNNDTAALLKDSGLFTLKAEGLRELISEGKEDLIRARFEALRMMASSMGGVVIDKEEELSFITRQFSGVTDVARQFLDILVAASGVPHSIILGEAPGSGLLGGEGSAEEKTWAKRVSEYQQQVIYPRLRRLYRLIWLAKDGPSNGEEPESWDVKFAPLLEESQEEKVQALTGFVGALSQGISAQFLLPEEARLSFKSGKLNYEIMLDEDAWQQKQEQESQSFDFGSLGGDAGGVGTESTQESPSDDTAQIQQDSFNKELLDRWDKEFNEKYGHIKLDAEFKDEALHQQAVKEAKVKFKVYPSRYAGIWIAKRYKELAKQKRGDSAIATPPMAIASNAPPTRSTKAIISVTGEVLGYA